MIEEFDAIQRINLTQTLLYAAGVLLIGIILEVILRFGKRWSSSKDYAFLSTILNTLTWQPLIWGILLGIVFPLLDFISVTLGWQIGPGLMQSLMLISATVIIVRLINGLLEILTVRIPAVSVSLLNNLLTGLGVLLVAAIVLGYLFNISYLVILAVIFGGIFGLTVVFQEPVSKLVSGVLLTFSNRLKLGDWIRLPSGREGRVIDIQWDVTIVQELSNNAIIVPNNVMTQSEIINYNHPALELRVAVAVAVSDASDLEHVEQVTLEEADKIMREINEDKPTAAPVVRYKDFAASSIDMNVSLWAVSYTDQFLLRHKFIKRLHKRYEEEGIVIPYPITTLHTLPGQSFAGVNQSVPEVSHPDVTTEESTQGK